jgi:cation:H+ antiporter
MPFAMNIMWALVFLVGGLLILWKSADLLVDNAVRIAEWLRVSPLVIGLTVVAMGTSAPEVAASISAVLRGAGDAAIGNVYGSNIANLALVGGLSALIQPITVGKLTLRREVPVMLAAALLLWPFLRNLSLSRAEGIALLAVFFVLLGLTIWLAKKEAADARLQVPRIQPDVTSDARFATKSICFVVIGLAGVAFGADTAVRGAVYIGQRIGLTEAVIGQTIIAVGTSLPELATCVAAALKKHHDISIGNLVGSNIFNTLLVTGAAAGTAGAVRPFTISPRLIGSYYLIMVGVSAAFVIVIILGRRTVGRRGGTVLLCGYVAYIFYLLLHNP